MVDLVDHSRDLWMSSWTSNPSAILMKENVTFDSPFFIFFSKLLAVMVLKRFFFAKRFALIDQKKGRGGKNKQNKKTQNKT